MLANLPDQRRAIKAFVAARDVHFLDVERHVVRDAEDARSRRVGRGGRLATHRVRKVDGRVLRLAVLDRLVFWCLQAQPDQQRIIAKFDAARNEHLLGADRHLV